MRITVSQLRRIIKEEVSRATRSRRRLYEGMGRPNNAEDVKKIIRGLAGLISAADGEMAGFQDVDAIAKILQDNLESPVDGMWTGYEDELLKTIEGRQVSTRKFAIEMGKIMLWRQGDYRDYRVEDFHDVYYEMIDALKEPIGMTTSPLRAALESLEDQGAAYGPSGIPSGALVRPASGAKSPGAATMSGGGSTQAVSQGGIPDPKGLLRDLINSIIKYDFLNTMTHTGPMADVISKRLSGWKKANMPEDTWKSMVGMLTDAIYEASGDPEFIDRDYGLDVSHDEVIEGGILSTLHNALQKLDKGKR